MKKRKLGEIVNITKGRKAQNVFDEKINNASRYIQIEDLRTDNKLQYTTDTNGIFVSEGDLCIAWDGANAGTVGYGLSGIIGSTIAKLHITDSEIETPYIGRFLQSKFNVLNGKTTGTTIPHVERRRLEELEFPHLSPAEQRRIAAILDKADAIRRKRQQSLELADSLLKSVFLDMFGDPVTNPKGWEKLPLGCIGELNRGVSKHRPRNDPKLLNGQHPLVQTGEVANANLYITEYTQTYSDLGLKQSKMWPQNTLCITIAANIAKTAILGFDACFPDSVVGFLPNEKTTTFFVHYWFSFFQKILEAEAPESAQKNINLKILNELQVIHPPFALQQKFSNIVHKVEFQRVRLRTSLNKADQAFKSLQQSFFG